MEIMMIWSLPFEQWPKKFPKTDVVSKAESLSECSTTSQMTASFCVYSHPELTLLFPAITLSLLMMGGFCTGDA